MPQALTKFLLDSGDPDEYQKIGSKIWGATTNPTLIAKKLANKKITQKEAFELQKQIVLEILKIVPGAVSAEVYADQKTTALEMVKRAREIAGWHKRVVVKLPTTLEGPGGIAKTEIATKVNGRQPYVDGTLTAVRFLRRQIAAGAKGRVFSMIDVLASQTQ